jgi:hypothetical protein
VANLGFQEVAFPAPVFVGDTLLAETRVLGLRGSASRPGQGVVTFEHLARSQHGAVVVDARRALAEHPLDPDRVIARVNAAGGTDHDLDLEALRRMGYRTLMLAKTESAA